LKEDHLAYRSSLSLKIAGGHCLFLRNFESPKRRSTQVRWGLEIYRAARNRTAEVSVPCVSAKAPEFRRPRFSFLYDQLVKEPGTREASSNGGERVPLLSQHLRTTDPIDQLATLNFGDQFIGFSTTFQNRRPPYLNDPTASVKALFSRIPRWGNKTGVTAAFR
jgi:hypothetical protein